MAVGFFFMRLLEVMFFLGIIGSAVVVVITSVQDAQELFESDEHPSPGEQTP